MWPPPLRPNWHPSRTQLMSQPKCRIAVRWQQQPQKKTKQNKKQEDGGHFVVLCNTMLMSISCLCILVRTFWYIYLDIWKYSWCGSLREGNFSRPLTTCYQKIFYEVDHLLFLIVLQGVQEYEKVANEVEQKTDSTISGKRSYYYIISVDQFYSYFYLLISDLRLVAKVCSHRFCWRCRTLTPQ